MPRRRNKPTAEEAEETVVPVFDAALLPDVDEDEDYVMDDERPYASIKETPEEKQERLEKRRQAGKDSQ